MPSVRCPHCGKLVYCYDDGEHVECESCEGMMEVEIRVYAEPLREISRSKRKAFDSVSDLAIAEAFPDEHWTRTVALRERWRSWADAHYEPGQTPEESLRAYAASLDPDAAMVA